MALPRLVQYRSSMLVTGVVTSLVLMTAGPLMFISSAHSSSFMLKASSLVVMVGSWMFGPPFILHFGKRLITREPAFAIYPDGLFIGLLMFEKTFFMPWKEIDCVYELAQICIRPVDLDGFMAKRPAWIRWIYGPNIGQYGTLLTVSPSAVDIDWKEFSELVDSRVAIGETSKGSVSISAEERKRVHETLWVFDHIGDIQKAIDNKLSLGGRLATKSDYQEHFKRNLIGTWYTQGFSASPVDKDMVLYPDGTGYAAMSLMGHSLGVFEWRELDDFCMEIRNRDQPTPWRRVEWFVTESEGGDDRPRVALSCFDYDDGSDVSDDEKDDSEDDGDFEIVYELHETWSFGGLPKGKTAG